MANEKRLIDANALMDAFRRHMAWKFDRERCVSEENCKTCDRGCLWRNIVMDAPTVDAVEVVHGRWINRTKVVHNMVDERNDCSNCGQVYWFAVPDFNYCPNCGAKMDGDGNG